MQDLFDEITTYVRFDDTDKAALLALSGPLAPSFEILVTDFYSRIAEHPAALSVISGGDAQQRRLQDSLRAWLERFFGGPWDDEYFALRARIGRRHVEVGLPQHYMLTALSLIREGLVAGALAHAGDRASALSGVTAINKLCDIELAIMLHTYREDSRHRLQASERLATFGEAASSICHELRNPLGVVASSTFLLTRRLGEDAYAQNHLERIQRQVDRSMKIIGSMIDIVRDAPLTPMRTAAAELAQQAVEQLAEERQRSVTLELPKEPVSVLADAGKSGQVLSNLLHNAADASGSDGDIALSVRTWFDGPRPMVRFLVSDSGPGVDPGVRTRLFEPLVTTKQMGVGLGLALSRKLARQQDGELTVVEGALSGAGFAFDLPFARPSKPPPGA